MKSAKPPPNREAIQKMIYELAKGNFSYRIPLSIDPSIIDIALPLNLLAEELSRFLIHPGLFSEKDIENPFVFVIDTRYLLCGVNANFSDLLGRPEEALIGTSLQDYLVPSSFRNLQQQLDGLALEGASSVKLLFRFRPTPSLFIDGWGYCHVLSGPTETYYFIRGSKLMTQSSKKSASSPAISSSYLKFGTDVESLREVKRYILSHLDESLPKLSTLSRHFHLNEYKLKRGFKDLYQTTIFRFHRDNRLEQALVMIKNTPMALNAIADTLGFKSFPHFSKVFKEKFGHPPSFFR